MLETGSVVRSLAGRDKDSLLAVVKAENDAVYVCDGGERPLERPKRKNPRHLCDTGMKLPMQTVGSNKALRKALAGFAESV